MADSESIRPDASRRALQREYSNISSLGLFGWRWRYVLSPATATTDLSGWGTTAEAGGTDTGIGNNNGIESTGFEDNDFGGGEGAGAGRGGGDVNCYKYVCHRSRLY